MRALAVRAFYAPGDWLVRRTTRRQRCAIAAWALIFWLGPGFVVWLFLLHSLWFVGLMSIVALQLSAFAWCSAETPVENER